MMKWESEDAAREYFEVLRWPDGPVCVHCGSRDSAWALTPREGSSTRKGLWKCKVCRKQFRVTLGSIFAHSHIPLCSWLEVIELLCTTKRGISARELCTAAGFGSYRTATGIYRRLRWALTQEPMTHLRRCRRPQGEKGLLLPYKFEKAVRALLCVKVGPHEPGTTPVTKGEDSNWLLP